MLQLENKTPFAATMMVLPDRHGVDTLYVLVKATLSLHPRLALSPVQVPPTMADEHHGDPATTSLKQASELHIGKPGTDVLLVGRAWAQSGRQVQQALVTVTVAERRKSVRVLGDRQWRGGYPTVPQPFESMPLIWERSFGGAYQVDGRMIAEERNPIGVGLTQDREARDVEAQPLPNLEDPGEPPLQDLGQRGTPACFAPTSPAWLPRRRFAGTYDERWQRTRAPYLPDDFDPRFLQCAAPELVFDRFLQGGEPVEVQGASPRGSLIFQLPLIRLEINVDVAGGEQRPPANLETVLIEPDANRLCLTWRASLPCDRQVRQIRKVVIAPAPGGRP